MIISEEEAAEGTDIAKNSGKKPEEKAEKVLKKEKLNQNQEKKAGFDAVRSVKKLKKLNETFKNVCIFVENAK